MAVTKPEHIPAAIAAKIDKKGCPLTATAAPTAAPSVKAAISGKVTDIQHGITEKQGKNCQ